MDDRVRDLINRIRETAAVAADAAEAAAKQVSQKTGETLEIAKLNMRIFDLNTEIGVSQRDIGKIVYDTHLGKETNEDVLSSIISGIDDKFEEIASCKAKIAELRKSVTCPVCGEACSRGDVFCKRCGASVSK